MMKVSSCNMRDQLYGLHASLGCNCMCEVCGDGDAGCCAHTKIFKHMTLLWMECMCPKGKLDQWHNLACFMGECKNCGVKLLQNCLQELSSSTSALVK
jgi:hypothetical protein